MTGYTVLVAAPTPRSALSRTAALAAETLVTTAGLRGSGRVVDLAALGGDLLARTPTAEVRAALAAARTSELIVVASPLVHGTYSGVLKVFLDQLPELGLSQAVVVPIAAVPDLRNGHGVEEDLRLVFSDLGAWVSEPGLLLAEPELAAPDGIIDAWAEVAAPSLREALSVGA